MALSADDAKNWLLLIEDRLEGQTPKDHTSSESQLFGPIRQRRRRLKGAQVIEVAARYLGGATVYELAAEFGCNRTTVAERLKKAGIAMRCQTLTSDAVDSMGHLDALGLSLIETGKQLRFCANTVRNCRNSRRWRKSAGGDVGNRTISIAQLRVITFSVSPQRPVQAVPGRIVRSPSPIRNSAARRYGRGRGWPTSNP